MIPITPASSTATSPSFSTVTSAQASLSIEPTQVPPSLILADFPLAPGATWEYSADILYGEPDDDQFATWSGVITIQVTDLEINTNGTMTFTLQEELNPAPPEGVWRQSRTYQYTLSGDGIFEDGTKIYQWPLSDGMLWETWSGPGYPTEVTYAGDIRTTYGELSGCYTFLLSTLPDVTIKTFCPGIGFVALAYEHYGTPQEENIKLIEFTPGK